MYLTALATEFEVINSEVPNIHYGGCCVFAEALYRLLIKLGKKPEIVISTENPLRMLETFENRSPYYIDVLHAFIMVDGFIIDNNGVYNNTDELLHHSDFRYSCMKLTLKEVHWLNNKVGGWNRRYNRELTPKMKLLIKKLYKKFAN